MREVGIGTLTPCKYRLGYCRQLLDTVGLSERARLGLAFNEMVARGELSAPVVIGRDHLDSGSVASPNRETEAEAALDSDGIDFSTPVRLHVRVTVKDGDVTFDFSKSDPQGRGPWTCAEWTLWGRRRSARSEPKWTPPRRSTA